ncbi:MAG: hypothetical protein HZC55_11620 [Verrucomicrobia bacterium]|nr:hypothetical protein [Verrucomicrobiota bacterium]
MKPRFLAFLLIVLPAAVFAQDGKPDREGFIRDWLVLAPFAIPAESGAEEIDKKQFADEAQPAARAGGKQKIGDKELVWRKVTSKEFFLDFRVLHPDQYENVAAWAVAYVTSSEEKSGLTLHLNSNDQGKVYLNGREIVKFTDTRTLEKDAEDKAPGVTLKKGVNVLVLKVINQENNWQGSVRFTGPSGRPVTDLTIATAPKG